MSSSAWMRVGGLGSGVKSFEARPPPQKEKKEEKRKKRERENKSKFPVA